jgi:predicted NAD/FAD-dependent oxidoreductase
MDDTGIMGETDVIVIGAGIAGLSAARRLGEGGLSVCVLEKSRGLGGRAATRRIGASRVDHGAQYFTAREPGFQEQVNVWLAQGALKVWSHGFHRMTAEGKLEAPSPGYPRYLPLEGMSGLGRLLAAGLEVAREKEVCRLKRLGDGWEASLRTGGRVKAPRLIVAIPPAQALRLLADLPMADEDEADAQRRVMAALAEVRIEPCFALMMGFPLSKAPPWQGLRVEGDRTLAWLAHDSSKRENPPETVLVLHSTANFAKHHLQSDPALVEEAMRKAALRLNGWLAEPSWSALHRWRYSLVSRPHPAPFLQLHRTLALCGDWCGGGKVEAAYLSGLAAAEALL